MGKKEVLDTSFNVDKMAGYLARFYGGNIEIAKKMIEVAMKSNPGISKERLFQKLSEGEGPGKPHISRAWGTYREGERRTDGRIKTKRVGRFRMRG